MDNRIKNLFERYQSEQANEQERIIVETWFADLEKEQKTELNETEKIALFAPMDDAIDRMLFKPRRLLIYNRYLQAAAVILVAFGIVLFKYQHTATKKASVISYTLISVPKGEKKNLLLADGSTVFLNSGSAIRIPSNYNVKSREVSLSGEAYFEVKHNAAKPFTIHSGKLLITDLGTAFDVKAYPEDREIHVAVESGKVQVGKNKPNGQFELYAAAITRNQQLVYNERDNSHAISPVKTSDVIAWQQNKLSFDNASFGEIAPLLERWYNVSVKLNGRSACRRYTVSFNNEPVDHVLNVMTRLAGITYSIKDKVVVINLKNCRNMK
ncbi:FecR family protein [Mucilaginibacter sp. OK098]|uniref:FecR family protein n=1 Tax=Mucilaginibacter sp. OK098 TaxID=1855297 RepID=UPI00091E1892|nr:FecR domain-containing protein [Mucilaginibacter sp. OK098]SHM90829.1 FecR family protein [Mucilaginibacter sp. OK098]